MTTRTFKLVFHLEEDGQILGERRQLEIEVDADRARALILERYPETVGGLPFRSELRPETLDHACAHEISELFEAADTMMRRTVARQVRDLLQLKVVA